jgi:hypothetical protein
VPYGTADPSFAAGGRGVDWKPVPRESTSKVEVLPMASLLSQALVAFAIEYERVSAVVRFSGPPTSCGAWMTTAKASRRCRNVGRTAFRTSSGLASWPQALDRR